VDRGLQFVRRSYENGNYYFIANWGSERIDDWVQIEVNAKSAAIFDPMLEKSGVAKVQSPENGSIQVYLQLAPGESSILRTFNYKVSGRAYDYFKPAGEPVEITGTWKVSFIAGGPEKPDERYIENLSSWTDWEGDAVKRFSGMAKYATTFPKPAGAGKGWMLDLGRVAESARVSLNGKEVATLMVPTFRVFLNSGLVKESNLLEIDVSNLMANRIIDMEKKGVLWKKFYNINFPARQRENLGPDNLFSAVNWQPLVSGLLGPVTLTPVATF
jgi:hypothetical protein